METIETVTLVGKDEHGASCTITVNAEDPALQDLRERGFRVQNAEAPEAGVRRTKPEAAKE